MGIEVAEEIAHAPGPVGFERGNRFGNQDPTGFLVEASRWASSLPTEKDLVNREPIPEIPGTMATPKTARNRKRFWFVVPALILAVLATGWLPIWDIAPEEFPDLIREPAAAVPDSENAYTRLFWSMALIV